MLKTKTELESRIKANTISILLIYRNVIIWCPQFISLAKQLVQTLPDYYNSDLWEAFNVQFEVAIPVSLTFSLWVGTAMTTTTMTTPTRTTSGRRKVDYKRSRSICVWASIRKPTWQTLNTKLCMLTIFLISLFVYLLQIKSCSIFHYFLYFIPFPLGNSTNVSERLRQLCVKRVL